MRGPGTRMPPSRSFLYAMRPPGHVKRHRTPRTVGAAHRSAARAWGARPVPFRTRKLSPIAPRVLRGQPVGGQGAADRWTAPSRHWECRRGRPRGLPLFCAYRAITPLSLCFCPSFVASSANGLQCHSLCSMEVIMAEAGIGVDIVEISRMNSILEKTPAFARRVFTDEERSYCDASSRPAAHYASRFASREAVLKALGTGFSQGVGRKDVSVTRDKLGKPKALLSGRALEIAQELGVVEVALSITLTGDLAVANAIAITEDARPKPKEEKVSTKERVAQTFKEARSVLDELEQLQQSALSEHLDDDPQDALGA